MQILVFVIGFILFIGLILIHEWGHFIVARRNGVEVEEFGLGLPPRAWRKKLKSGMVLSLNWLPLGGFVKLKGELDSDVHKGSFGAASLWDKSKIMLAGVTMNLLAGLILLTILAFIGVPKLIDNQFSVPSDTKIVHRQVLIGYIEPDSPAYKAGLSGTDAIKALGMGGQTKIIQTVSDLQAATKEFAGQSVQVTVSHKGKQQEKTLVLRTSAEVEGSKNSANPKGYLGIAPNQLDVYRATWSAPIVALGFTRQLVVLTTQGLGHALGGLGSAIAGSLTNNHQARVNGQTEATAEVGGPVAIGALLWSGGSLGLSFMLMIIAVVSLTLAFMNVLPLPALDGGRLAMILISRGIFKRSLSKKVEERLVGASMALLLVLFTLITIVDVKRFL
ncbi:MAG: M50 family metallopeptidase [bacterium]|nr:M50 family metallopeptidase [bacterium]